MNPVGEDLSKINNNNQDLESVRNIAKIRVTPY